MRSWWPPAYSTTFDRCFGHGSASSIWMVTSMWWLMTSRSSAVSVPARMVRFVTSSSGEEARLRRPPALRQRYLRAICAHALQVRVAHAIRRRCWCGAGTRGRRRSRARRAASAGLPRAELDLGVALEHLEARVDELDAVEDRLQLGRLVDHVHRRGDLAAVVQQAGDLELVAVALGHREIARAGPRSQRSTASASIIVSVGTRSQWPPVYGRLVVDRGVDELDERLEQLLELVDQQPVGERDRRLRGERLGQALVGLGERRTTPLVAVLAR